MQQSEAEITFADELIEMIGADVSVDPAHDIVASTDLLLTGLVDSMGVLVIVAWLEDRLGIEIDPADVVLQNFQTVDHISAYVQRRI